MDAVLSTHPDDEARYLALRARDARFDGLFFTGVTSTGIYCRPVCAVRTPRRENCRFFRHAAQAERDGFRPCLRCRPELAPGPDHAARWSIQDASAILAQQAARLLDEPDAWGDEAPSVQGLADRLGVTDRHVRRLFEAQFGVSPLQYLQTRRLLTAKQLLTDTRLPVGEVAWASGFASLRRFHAAFVAHYRLSPGQLRREGQAADGEPLTLRLAWRPPLAVDALLGFFAARQVTGVERVDLDALTYARTLGLTASGTALAGWFSARFNPSACRVDLTVSDGLRGALPRVIRRVRALFDLDADPQAIAAVLEADFPGCAGWRVPGAADGFELAVRAVLGQQVTVAAARTLTRRLVARLGEPLATPVPGLDRLFPTPQALLALGGAAGDTLGALGIVRQRQQALLALAHAVADGGLRLHPGADPATTCAALKALPGFGDWTAQYIAMRALRWPDAFPAGDVALQKALGVRDAAHPRRAAEAAERASAAWQPWRSYAVLRIWGGQHQLPKKEQEQPI